MRLIDRQRERGKREYHKEIWLVTMNISMITNTFGGGGGSVTFFFVRNVWTIRILITYFNIKVRIWQLNNIVCVLLRFWIVIYQMKRDFEANLCCKPLSHSPVQLLALASHLDLVASVQSSVVLHSKIIRSYIWMQYISSNLCTIFE